MTNVDIIKCVALSYKLGTAPKDFIREQKFRPTCRAVSVFRRKLKRFAVSKEQNTAVYGMHDPL